MKSLQFFVPTNAATEIEISFGITDSPPAFSQESDIVVTPSMHQLQDIRTTIEVLNQ